MKGAIRKLNNIFISFVLAVIYVAVVGVSFATLNLLTFFRLSTPRDSYWEDADQETPPADYFESPY